MDSQTSYQKNLQVSVNLSNKFLAQSKSSKRLLRKPSNKLINSPKQAKTSIFHNESSNNKNRQTLKPHELHIQSIQDSNQAHPQIKHNLDSIKNLCYISPRNSLGGPKRFMRMVPQKTLGNAKQQQLSIDSIETSFIQLKQNFQLSSTNKILSKKALSKTVRQIVESNSPQIQRMLESQRSKLRLNQLQRAGDIEEKKNLIKQNASLNCRIDCLKQENQYLYQQIQILNCLLKEEKKDFQRLSENNLILQAQIRRTEEELDKFKSGYKINQMKNKSYQILEHIYLKTKNQLEEVIKKNRSLMMQNEKLSKQIIVLSKLIQNSPKQQTKSMKKIKTQTNSIGIIEITNKQTFQSRQICQQHFQTLATPKSKRKAQKQNFFQLSPQ